MAVQKIDYENKIGLQNDENVPNKNKVTDNDMNEIKSKVNNNADELSTAQQNIEDLQSGQGTASGDIASLKNRVTTLEGDNTKNKQDIANKVDKVEGKGLSTEDYTTAEKEKLAELKNYDDAEIKKEIQDLESDVSDIKSEQETQNDLLQRTQNALINITTPKSSNINVKDSSDLNAKIDVFGISEQKTRSGINLTNYEDWTGIGGNEQITEKDDDKVVCAITSSSYGVCDIERTLKPNTNYTACADFEFNGTFGNQYGLRVNVNGSITSLKTDGLVNFTTDETGKARMQCYVGFPYTGANATLTVSNIRLYEGTYTKENIPNYEQYGASPSPEFPSKIENVTGNIDITVCNENFCNTDIIQSLNNSAVTINSKNSFTIDLSKGSISNWNAIDLLFGKNRKDLQHTLSYHIKQNNDKFLPRFVFYYDDGSNSTPGNNGATDLDLQVSSTPGKIIDRISIAWSSQSAGGIVTFSDIQLNQGGTKADFVENKQQLITFPLSEGQKLYNGDYPASDGIHHVRKQVVLDGTENWMVSGNSYYLTVAGKKLRYELTKGKMLCTHFKETTTGVAGEVEVGEFFEGYYSKGNRNVFFNYDNGVGGVDNWKSYLAEQKQAGTPVIVEYELETEEIEPYTPEQQEAYNKLQNVLSYYNVTNVFTDKAQLVFKYIADTKTWTVNLVKNEIANTNQQILEIAGGN